MIIKIFFVFFIIFFSSKSYSTNIRVLDFQQIIENNQNLTLFYDLIGKDQKPYKEQFKNDELNLQKELERIEKLNLILDPTELEKEIETYNNKLSNFNLKIEKFNLHYEVQINNLKNLIIKKILEVLKKYSEDNKIDLVLDVNHYILSSNAINITNIIEQQVNKIKIEVNFEKY